MYRRRRNSGTAGGARKNSGNVRCLAASYSVLTGPLLFLGCHFSVFYLTTLPINTKTQRRGQMSLKNWWSDADRGKTEIMEENQKFHLEWPPIEPRPPHWEADDCLCHATAPKDVNFQVLHASSVLRHCRKLFGWMLFPWPKKARSWWF